MSTVLEVSGVVKKYMMGSEEVRAVDGVSMALEAGDFVAIMGPSGSGKTTLLNLLGCIDRPSEGTVSVSGRVTSKMTDRELDKFRLLNIGFVFQRINLVPTLSARENIELPLELAGLSHSERRKRASELLALVGLEKRAGHRPAQLSGGEQQRVGIARSLANEPGVILADEPTGNLDSTTAAQIMKIFSDLNRDHGQTLVVVTHDSGIAAKCKKTLTIRDGRFEI